MLAVRIFPIVLVSTLGCRQIAGLDDPLPRDSDGNPGPDGAPVCYGTGLVQICLASRPTDAKDLASGTIDTSTQLTCAGDVVSGGDGLCVVAARTFTIASGVTVRGTGTQPLVMVADETIAIDGTIDVASHRSGSGNRGAAANFADCATGTAPGTGGGGPGGSFAASGGAGGSPNEGTPGAALAAPTVVHGGCPGRDGGGTNAGKKGDGGGAVYLIAGTSIGVTGAINASGAGTSKGEDDTIGGGGGGGSGGMIGLDAPMVQIDGVVFANGGGGGEGGDGISATSGNDPVNGAPGLGGDGSGSGGPGGDGGAGATASGSAGGAGVAGSRGGGGGGGSAGVILLFGTRTGAGTISPPSS